MIQRYLGNKAPICASIVDLIRGLAEPGELVFDAFSGSLSVSRALKSAGFRVAANDINYFSWLYYRAYMTSSELPRPEGPRPVASRNKSEAWRLLVDELTLPYEADADIPLKERRTDIFDHYCEEGRKSEFRSLRGTSGRRRFFSAANAAAIDRALNRIRHWHRSGRLGEQTRCLLTASLMNAVERVSNTQGTYHDFPREFIDSRALHPMRLLPPAEQDFEGPRSNIAGKAEDSITYAASVPAHKVAYLDPPYNFRQYTSYYFMLNLLASHAEIEDLSDYFGNLQHVRGQNMSSDFKSTFCSKRQFVPSLKKLIENCDAEYILLSYFDGRNHWGSFKSENDLSGRPILENLLSGPEFVPGSLSCLPVNRMNYQSYGGFKSKEVQEFLFVAQKRKVPAVLEENGAGEWIGQEVAVGQK